MPYSPLTERPTTTPEEIRPWLCHLQRIATAIQSTLAALLLTDLNCCFAAILIAVTQVSFDSEGILQGQKVLNTKCHQLEMLMINDIDGNGVRGFRFVNEVLGANAGSEFNPSACACLRRQLA